MFSFPNMIRFGSGEACELINQVQGNTYHSFCDRYVYPQQYFNAGVVFWLGVVVATCGVIFFVRRFIANAFEI